MENMEVIEWEESDECVLDEEKHPDCEMCSLNCVRGKHILSHRKVE